MGIAVALSSIAAAIPLRWWRMMARLKAYNPLFRSAWSAADRAATTSSTGHPAGAIESATKFNGASEMEAKAIGSIDLI